MSIPFPSREDGWITIDDKENPAPTNGAVVWILAYDGIVFRAHLKKAPDFMGFPVEGFIWQDIYNSDIRIPEEEVTHWKPILDSEL